MTSDSLIQLDTCYNTEWANGKDTRKPIPGKNHMFARISLKINKTLLSRRPRNKQPFLIHQQWQILDEWQQHFCEVTS